MIDLLRNKYSVHELCRFLNCSRSGYYDWISLGRPQHKSYHEETNQLIMKQYQKNPVQGIVKLKMNIKAIYSITLTKATIYRYMKLNDVQSITRRKRKKYAKVEHHRYPNLLQRDFTTTAPNQKWSIDVSYLLSTGRTQYLCALKDLYDKSILAYTISDFNDNSLVLDTVKKAVKKVPLSQRKGLILHSDQGSQFTSAAYHDYLIKQGIRHSVSAKGSCVDNCPIESFFSILKSEAVYLYRKITYQQIQEVVNDFIPYYNKHRLQENLKELSPYHFRRIALS